jgi:hypothetical protein
LRPHLRFTIHAAKYIPKLSVLKISLRGAMKLIGSTGVVPDDVRNSEVIHESREQLALLSVRPNRI